ncbi:glycoside hydrolase family 16 protein [Seminavis robusta]|uniref:Glycoside hydrolase family 16 protein n=1 Tax=Seminavis robusta TaxID=568900 RepID=A0A9N8DX91_9STRA|nr:glycoside hydrolase family 16 protein [Seminavis robusta]|eukprot:Sro362_g126800.1 glycoside hydrolase family 16 protein (810) ;mRNA; f:46826-49428
MKCLLLLVLTLSSPVGIFGQCPTLIWSDEFDGTELDLNKWSYMVGDGCDLGEGLCGWGNNEWQFYTQGENVQVSNGTLKIIAKYDQATSSYTSARISSLGKADFDLTKPLRFEASMKVPKQSQGLWPAFWMMPSLQEITSWPSGGEIDIMEFIGKEPNQTYGVMHYGVEWGDKSEKGALVKFPEHAGDYFHDFALEKNENSLSWFIDGNKFLTLTDADIEPKFSWPFESIFHLILNMAVGGNWPEYPDQTTSFPNTFEIDYIRVYDMTTTTLPTPTLVGDTLVQFNAQDKMYCVQINTDLQPHNDYDTYIEWWVPEGSYYIPVDDKPNCIKVGFGTHSGYVEASIYFNCGRTYELWMPVQVQDLYGTNYRFWAGASQAVYESSTGTYSEQRDDAASSANITYQRNLLEVYDHITFSSDAIPNPQLYVESARKFYMDALSPTAAGCTRFWIQLEDSSLATPDNYPTGRHSRYLAFLEKDGVNYQKLDFDFYDTPDTTVTSVDQIVILIDSFVQRSDTYYLTNWVSAAAGCTSDCLPVSKNTCQLPAKSEEGACTDGFNNDGFGWNGDLTMDCQDSDCYLIDPACQSTTPAPTPAVEICDNGIDDDQNGWIDCADIACADSPLCGSWWNPSCDAYSACVDEGHVGECCPNVWGEYKSCCTNETPGSCSVHPACDALGLVGDCCPTPEGNVFLDCCQPQLCVSNPRCSGLQGACCPTDDGVFLECCEERPETCEIHPKCDALGLTGQCCPTADNVFLECCEARSCDVHPACSALGLADDCCPTRDGVFLDCCNLDMPFFDGFTGEVVTARTP